MFNKIDGNELLDVYGPLLTKRQQEIMELYYAEDFSYGEISETLHISRAAIMDAVHRANAQLEKYESVVGYIAKKKEILNLCHHKQYNEIENIL